MVNAPSRDPRGWGLLRDARGRPPAANAAPDVSDAERASRLDASRSTRSRHRATWPRHRLPRRPRVATDEVPGGHRGLRVLDGPAAHPDPGADRPEPAPPAGAAGRAGGPAWQFCPANSARPGSTRSEHPQYGRWGG